MLKLILFAAAAAFIASTASPAQEPAMHLPAPSKSGYAPVNGVEIFYAIYGEGKPLVLLHGGFEHHEMFGPNLAALAENHTVIGVDLQGHGRTPPFDREMTFDAMAADIAELIRHLGYAKADLVGYSLGGRVALRTALDHPEVVERLVLVSTPFAFSGWHDFNAQGMRGMAAASDQAAEGMKQTPLYQAYVAVAPDPDKWPKTVAQTAALVGADYDWSAEVPRIAAPTLLVVGDWDSVRIGHATRFFELLGGGAQDAGWDGAGMNQNRLAVIPSATHYSIGGDPRLAQSVIPFLDTE